MKSKLIRIAIAAIVLTAAGIAAGKFLRADDVQAQDAAQAQASAEGSAIEQSIHDYIMSHPEVIIESLTAHQQRTRQEATDKALNDHGEYLLKGSHPEGGNPQGDVTLVEFFDYNCGYCKKAMHDVMKLVKDDGKVRMVFIEFPILGPTSEVASHYALASRAQGKYVEFHTALMESTGALSEGKLEEIAKSVGLDVEKLRSDAKSKEIQDEIQKNREVVLQLGVTGTPGFLIGKDLYPGYLQYDDLRRAVAASRQG